MVNFPLPSGDLSRADQCFFPQSERLSGLRTKR
jgi:hypothetical protein